MVGLQYSVELGKGRKHPSVVVVIGNLSTASFGVADEIRRVSQHHVGAGIRQLPEYLLAVTVQDLVDRNGFWLGLSPGSPRPRLRGGDNGPVKSSEGKGAIHRPALLRPPLQQSRLQ